MANIRAEINSDTVSVGNAPWYPKFVATTIPMIRGPIVWPTSLVMHRKPIAVPVRFLGASSLTRAEVEEVAIAKPSPYTARARGAHLTFMNKKGLEVLEVSEGEIVGKPWAPNLHPEDLDDAFKAYKKMLKTGESLANYECRFITRRGEGRMINVIQNINILRDQNGNIIGTQGIARDITERKQAEEEMRKSKEEYQTMLEESPAGICNIDIRGNFTYVNKELERVTGFSRKELLGKKWFNIARKEGILSKEHLKLAAKRIKERLMGRPENPVRLRLRQRDGSVKWVESMAKLIMKHRVPVGLQAVMQDVTELVESERALKEAVRNSEILNEKLRVMSGITRHDVRNKLQVARNTLFLAREKLGDDSETSEVISSLEFTCDDVERILGFARDYEQLGIEELTHVSIGNNVKEAVSLLPLAGAELEGIEIRDECQGIWVLADSMLQQLFYNLIDNSLKHGGDVSHIRIACETGKRSLKLLYEDNGVGIPKGEKKKIFEKGYGKDSGYGLFLIEKMCEVYGWTIKETGKPGKGAQFTITVPKLNGQGKANYKLN